MPDPPTDLADRARFDPASPADLDVLAGFMRALRAEDPFLPEAADERTALAAVAALIGDPRLGRAWVIRVDGEAAGYVILTLGYSIEFGGRTAFVDELYVAPPFRGRGAGRAALRYAADRASELGVRVVFLEVSPANHAARRLYERAGFAERDYRMMALPVG